MNPRQLEIIDGPLGGTCHELGDLRGFPVPVAVGFDVDESQDSNKHWYEIIDGRAFYISTGTLCFQGGEDET